MLLLPSVGHLRTEPSNRMAAFAALYVAAVFIKPGDRPLHFQSRTEYGCVLGGTFGFPHSMTSCITLAPVIRSCASRYGEKLRIFDAQGELVLADRIEALVSNLALPTRLRSFEIGLSTLAEIAALLRENYPNEVEDLGEGADRKLDDLLRSIW
jgi:hypothetical protein